MQVFACDVIFSLSTSHTVSSSLFFGSYHFGAETVGGLEVSNCFDIWMKSQNENPWKFGCFWLFSLVYSTWTFRWRLPGVQSLFHMLCFLGNFTVFLNMEFCWMIETFWSVSWNSHSFFSCLRESVACTLGSYVRYVKVVINCYWLLVELLTVVLWAPKGREMHADNQKGSDYTNILWVVCIAL